MPTHTESLAVQREEEEKENSEGWTAVYPGRGAE